jgi:L-rhamnose mutarotase
MERLCFTFEIAPGTEAEYDRLHRDIWPELADAILDAGYRNYSLFRRGTAVICVCECHPDVATVRDRMAARHSDVTDRWNVLMEPFITRMTDDEGNLFEYPLCWHLPEEDAP